MTRTNLVRAGSIPIRLTEQILCNAGVFTAAYNDQRDRPRQE